MINGNLFYVQLKYRFSVVLSLARSVCARASRCFCDLFAQHDEEKNKSNPKNRPMANDSG